MYQESSIYSRTLVWAIPILLAILLSGCSDSNEAQPAPAASASTASTSDIAVAGIQPGATPFISFVEIRGSNLHRLNAVGYAIEPKPGTASEPVSVYYTIAALRGRSFVTPDGSVTTVPVFGLYADHYNAVRLQLTFDDGSKRDLPVDIQTRPYSDPAGIYDRPTVLTSRVPGSSLGVNYIAMKSAVGPPVVIDTDANIRWVGTGVDSAAWSGFHDNAFVIGDPAAKKLRRLELDGALTETEVISSRYTRFHHNIDPGRHGVLIEVDAVDAGVFHIESILAEVSMAGVVLKEWDLAALLTNYMQSQGDDPNTFVRPGIDWFHMNGAAYDPSDDSIVVSSRENFLIKLDYDTGDIVWIFGDPSKHWYSFPSLRAKALTLRGPGLYPIGQHSPSITSDGLLMVFNNGLGSLNHPAGTPAGETRTYSVVSAYSIDAAKLEAQQLRSFDYNQSIYSDVCSNVYEGSDRSLLVNYAVAENRTKTRLVGLDAAHNVVFDFEYPTTPCTTSWNAIPIPLEDLRFYR